MSRVIIIGGGLAGLSCATRLHEQGVEFDLYEFSDAVGGRVRTDIVDGFRLDRGFQVLLTAYPTAQEMLDYEKLDLRRFQSGARIRFGGKFHRFSDPWRQPEHFIETAFSSLATIGDKLRVGRLRSELATRSFNEILETPDHSALEFLQQYGFSKRIIDSFFRPFFGGVFLEPELATSCRKLQFVFKMFGAGEAAVPAKGMQEIPEQLAAGLPQESIHLNRPVQSVAAKNVHLADGEVVHADCVVLAVDQSAAHRLLGEEDTTAWNDVRCVYFAADTPPLRQRGPLLLLNGEGRGPINNLATMTEVAPEYSSDERHLISVSVLDASIADGLLVETVREQAEEWFGDKTQSWRHIKTYHVRRALPRQPADFTTPSLQHESGVIRCGDSHGLASIQSALESGGAAAELILKRVQENTEAS